MPATLETLHSHEATVRFRSEYSGPPRRRSLPDLCETENLFRSPKPIHDSWLPPPPQTLVDARFPVPDWLPTAATRSHPGPGLRPLKRLAAFHQSTCPSCRLPTCRLFPSTPELLHS